MQDIKRAEIVLKKVLEDKKDNLIKLYLDLYSRIVEYPDLEKRLVQLKSEVILLRAMKEKSVKKKEEEIKMEQELRELEKVSGEMKLIIHSIKNESKNIERVESCIINPHVMFSTGEKFIK